MEEGFICGLQGCNSRFRTAELVAKHQRKKHLDIILPFKCEFCQRRFKKEDALQAHIRKAHKVRCEYCNASFAADRLAKHVAKAHDPDRLVYLCQDVQCLIICKSARVAAYHMVQCHGLDVEINALQSVKFSAIPASRVQNRNPKSCVICWEREADTAVVSCGHKKFCYPCLDKYCQHSLEKGCPVCRGVIEKYIRIYE